MIQADTRQHRLSLAVAVLTVGILWAFVIQRHGGAPDFKIREVSLAEAKSLIDFGALVIDVRDEEKYNFRHIPGAILVPVDRLRVSIPASVGADKTRNIVVYCNEGIAHGPEATHLLNEAGFSKAVNLRSGIEGWANAGFPVLMK